MSKNDISAFHTSLRSNKYLDVIDTTAAREDFDDISSEES